MQLTDVAPGGGRKRPDTQGDAAEQDALLDRLGYPVGRLWLDGEERVTLYTHNLENVLRAGQRRRSKEAIHGKQRLPTLRTKGTKDGQSLISAV